MKKIFYLFFSVVLFFCFSSCNTYKHSMYEPYTRVELKASDFELSPQFTAEATSTRVLYINWRAVFSKTHTGVMGEVPVIGTILRDNAAQEALYKLMKEHPGYDVVVYPQFETHKVSPILGSGFIRVTTVTVTARLGKLKTTN